jgi:osmotically-inducible protein OsmY
MSGHSDKNYSADTALAEAAIAAIETLTTIPLEAIKVTAQRGWLLLEGQVASRCERSTIEDVTRNLPGVRGVRDFIMVNSVSLFDSPQPMRLGFAR